MEEKFKRLIAMCKIGMPITQESVDENMFVVDRDTFKLVIPSDNTEEHGVFFVHSIQGHDCYSYNSASTHVYHVVDGTGKFIIDDQEVAVQPGDSITIEPNRVFTYMGEMVLTFEMTPNFREENDHIVRPVNYEKKGSSKK